MHDTGGYLGRVIADVPADLVGVLGGAWLHERHIRLRAWLPARTDEFLRERDVQEVVELSPNLASALIAGAQEEGREELMELWARLLANAVDPRLNSVRRSFIEAVKAMDPPDAAVLAYLHSQGYMRVLGFGTDRETIGVDVLPLRLLTNRNSITVSLNHLVAIGLMGKTDSGIWHQNDHGQEFMRACYPELSAA